MAFKGTYPKTDEFEVIDAMPVIGHLFCITTHHVGYASDRHGGLLTPEVIKASRCPCGICHRPYEDHEEHALIVRITSSEEWGSEEIKERLCAYVEKILPEMKAHGYEKMGFVKG